MPEHKATCAWEYLQRIEQQTTLSDNVDLDQSKSQPYSSQLNPPSELQGNNLHARHVELPEASDRSHKIRFFFENTSDTRLGPDALAHMLWWSEKNDEVETYKAALVTALRLNINIGALLRPLKHRESFDLLWLLARDIDCLISGVKQINDLGAHLGTTVLHAACFAGFAEVLEPLFWRGACFDVVNDRNETPLDLAIVSGDIDTIRFALALGADPNQTLPLFTTGSAGIHNIMTLLLEYGADINRAFKRSTLGWFTVLEEGETLLEMALKDESIEEVRSLLSLGANPNVGYPLWGLLDGCALQGCNACVHEDLALLLVERDVSWSLYGWTLFHHAAHRAHARLLRAALDRITSQLELDGQDRFGRTALHYAVGTLGKVPLHQTLEVVSMLLKAGADVNARNAQGETVLEIAAGEGSVELVQLLQDAKARPTGKSRYQALPNMDTIKL
jgi:ankyrin repeat protein